MILTFRRVSRAIYTLAIFGAVVLSATLCPAAIEYTGVNLSGAEFGQSRLPGTFGSDYTYPTNSEVDYFTGKGMNTFRLPFRWERLQPTNTTPLNSTELTRMTNFVSYATSKGANVILDPHNFERYYAPTNNFQQSAQGLIGGTSANTQAVVVTNAMFADFWGRIATQFKGNNHVIFNLMNEPNSVNLNTLVGSENAAIAAIRAAGASNLILVPGTSYTGAWTWTNDNGGFGASNAVAMLGITDPGNNFAFDMHQYMDSDGSGTHTTIDNNDPLTGVNRLTAATQWLQTNHLRGFLGEFAVDNSIINGSNPSDPNTLGNEVLNNMLTYMQQNNDAWLGWTWWGGGPWWASNSTFHIDPVSGQDQADIKVLQPYFVHPVAGDFDGNGIVDAADYTVWQNTFGQTGAGLAADGNHNGIVDAADFTRWRDHASAPGAGASSGGTVPEPSSLVLLATAGVAIVLCRGRLR
jgi:endoglucanase